MTTINDKELNIQNWLGVANNITSMVGQTGLLSYDQIGIFNSTLGAVNNFFSPQASPETQSNAVISVVGMLFSGLANKADAANQDVSISSDNINEGEKKVAEVRAANTEKIQNLIKEINDEVEKVQKEIEKVEKLGQEVEEEKQKLEEQKAIIDEAVSIINGDKEGNRTEAIKNLRDANNAVKELSTAVLAKRTDIEASLGIVENSAKVISEKQDKAIEFVNQDVNSIKEQIAKTSTESATGAGHIATGTSEVATGAALQAKAGTEIGAGIVTFGATAAAGAVDEQKALDYIKAGQTHITGGTENLAKLGTVLGTMGSSYSEVAESITKVGEATTKATKLIGDYHTKLSAVITSVGSWEEVAKFAQDNEEIIKKLEEEQPIELNTDALNV